MHELSCTLPGGHEAKILYLMDYPTAREEQRSIAWLQQRKLANDNKKEAYHRDLDNIVSAFVEGVAARPQFPPDVILVPPSGSRLFDPYLKGLRLKSPDLVVVDGLFAKAEGYAAGVNRQKFDDVLAAYTLTGEPPQSIAAANRVLILDDIFNTGNTAGAMISRLQTHMATQPQWIVACVLYVPLEPTQPDWAALMREMESPSDEGTAGHPDRRQ